jgi:hypothetical protein
MATFYSQNNRQLLLGLLSHNEVYQSNLQYFLSIFNETIENIERKKLTYNSLMDMNKAVIKKMSNLKKNVITEKKAPKKIDIFKQRLDAHEKNFSDSINIKKPDEIDFSDKIEDDNIKDVDSTLLQREKELKEIMGNYSKNNATDWLTSAETRETSNILKIEDSNIKVQAIDLEKKAKKQVRFEIKEKKETIKTFLDKLKKTNNDKSIEDRMEEISLKQDLIIKKLDRLLILKN